MNDDIIERVMDQLEVAIEQWAEYLSNGIGIKDIVDYRTAVARLKAYQEVRAQITQITLTSINEEDI